MPGGVGTRMQHRVADGLADGGVEHVHHIRGDGQRRGFGGCGGVHPRREVDGVDAGAQLGQGRAERDHGGGHRLRVELVQGEQRLLAHGVVVALPTGRQQSRNHPIMKQRINFGSMRLAGEGGRGPCRRRVGAGPGLVEQACGAQRHHAGRHEQQAEAQREHDRQRQDSGLVVRAGEVLGGAREHDGRAQVGNRRPGGHHDGRRQCRERREHRIPQGYGRGLVVPRDQPGQPGCEIADGRRHRCHAREVAAPDDRGGQQDDRWPEHRSDRRNRPPPGDEIGVRHDRRAQDRQIHQVGAADEDPEQADDAGLGLVVRDRVVGDRGAGTGGIGGGGHGSANSSRVA